MDAQNLEALRETVRVEMGDYNREYDAHKSRPLAREGNTLYVRRYWPGDLVAFDITNPNAPREIGHWSFSTGNTIKIIADRVYSMAWSGLSVDRLTDYHAHEYIGSWQVPDELRSSSSFSRNWQTAPSHPRPFLHSDRAFAHGVFARADQRRSAMSTLYALLWKEGREILPKVLVGVALAVVVYLMRNNADFNRSYAGGFEGLIMGGLAVMAIVLAMDAIARERSTGTLSFLIDKPIAGATVLTVKFLARAWRVAVGRANGLGDGVHRRGQSRGGTLVAGI